MGFMCVIVSAVDYDLRTVRARVRRLHGSEVRIFPTVDEAVDTRARGSSRPHVGPWRHAWRLLWPVAPARGFRLCQRLSRRARCTVRIPLHGRRNLVHQPPNRAPLHCVTAPHQAGQEFCIFLRAVATIRSKCDIDSVDYIAPFPRSHLPIGPAQKRLCLC